MLRRHRIEQTSYMLVALQYCQSLLPTTCWDRRTEHSYLGQTGFTAYLTNMLVVILLLDPLAWRCNIIGADVMALHISSLILLSLYNSTRLALLPVALALMPLSLPFVPKMTANELGPKLCLQESWWTLFVTELQLKPYRKTSVCLTMHSAHRPVTNARLHGKNFNMELLCTGCSYAIAADILAETMSVHMVFKSAATQP